MKILNLIALAAFAVLLSCCKTTQPTEPSGNIGSSLLQVTRILDTVQGKFYELAKANLSSTPGQVLVMTADWVKTLPNVKKVYMTDSTYIDIEMPSGLQTTFMINRYGSDGFSISRGGGAETSGVRLLPSGKANNLIKNKKVLIFAPFVGKDGADLYSEGELKSKIVDVITSAGKDFKVTLLEGGDCTIKAVESFGEYGLVIIDSHGTPDAFYTGDYVVKLDKNIDTNDAAIKSQVDYNLGSGSYEKALNGQFRFYGTMNMASTLDWATYLERNSAGVSGGYYIIVTSKFINALPPMPNTIILGNMCYSGWNITRKVSDATNVNGTLDPIRTAFTNRQLISYYSYGEEDGTSSRLGNIFAKRMEDSLVRSLIIDGDSTGEAYLNSTGQKFTGRQFNDLLTPDMPLQHHGADDYSYDNCTNEFTDERDGQKYKAVCIGKQNWMAENLRYNAPGSVFYDDISANGLIYGKLYNWITVMNGAASSSANPSGVRGICPKGWHVPSPAEWELLIAMAGHDIWSLKDKNYWNAPNTEATDKYGFSIRGGGWYDQNKYQLLNTFGEYLTSEKLQTGSVTAYRLQTGTNTMVPIAAGTGLAQDKKISCRCLKD